MSGDTVSGGAFAGLGADTTSFSITGNVFSSNFGDGVDIDQSVGTGGPSYSFVFENNNLGNNSHDAGQIFSNAFGNIDGNRGVGNSPNALFLNGQTANGASVHINNNTIPLGLEGSPGAGAPTLGVTTAATLAIGPGQQFVGGAQGSLGNLSGTLTIDGSTFDSLTGTSGTWNGITSLNNTTTTITNTTISHGSNAAGGPTIFPAQIVCQGCALTMSGDTVSGGAFAGLGADTTSFSITGNVFSSNFGDGVDIDQSVGTGGPSYSFVFENNNLGNNSHDAGQIFSNAFGDIDGNRGVGDRPNALFLNGQTANGASVHINNNTIPLGLEGSPGAGAPTLGVTTAATLAIGPGQQFVGGAQGSLGNLSGTLTIDGSTFDSLTGTSGTWNGITSLNNTTTTITNTTISHGSNAAGGPTIFPAQIVCQACNLSLSRTIVSGGAFGGIGVNGTATVSADHVDVVGNFQTGLAAAGTVTLTASIVTGNAPEFVRPDLGELTPDVLGAAPAGSGNIALDPLFVGPAGLPPSAALARDRDGRRRRRHGRDPVGPHPACGRRDRDGSAARPRRRARLRHGERLRRRRRRAHRIGWSANPQAATPLAAADASGATSFRTPRPAAAPTR